MELRVLGCSGGIGADMSTTSLLVDDDILIDGGTGLSLPQAARRPFGEVQHVSDS